MDFIGKLKRNSITLTIICFVFVLTSCAVRTPIKQISLSEVAQNLKYQNIILKDMALSSQIQNNVPPQIPIMQCEETAILSLKSKNIFKRVEKFKEGVKEKIDGNPYEEPSLIVESELTFLRIVSTSARLWGGVFTGRSTMKIKVYLKDASDGKIIAQEELVGAPNAYGSAYSFGGSDRTLPQNMGYLLADYILANVAN